MKLRIEPISAHHLSPGGPPTLSFRPFLHISQGLILSIHACNAPRFPRSQIIPSLVPIYLHGHITHVNFAFLPRRYVRAIYKNPSYIIRQASLYSSGAKYLSENFNFPRTRIVYSIESGKEKFETRYVYKLCRGCAK